MKERGRATAGAAPPPPPAPATPPAWPRATAVRTLTNSAVPLPMVRDLQGLIVAVCRLAVSWRSEVIVLYEGGRHCQIACT